ncbi:MAG: protease modulator HflC [Chitinispirillaceae bacterium]
MRPGKAISLISGIVLVILLLSYLLTYIVNYHETVIVTTFGRATESSVKNADGNGAGIYIKLPWPLQNVVRFDRRISLIEDRLEQQETLDKQVVIVKAFMTWRIEDPLSFYRMFSSTEHARYFLTERLHASKAEIGRFSFDDLTNFDPEKVKLEMVSEAMLERIKRQLSRYNTGVQIEAVGINRVVLPENITKSVFSRMKQTRQRFAQNARSEGNAVARSIKAKTDSDRLRIMAFAERMAQRLRAEGDSAAAQHYREYAQNPDLAIFLRKLDALKMSLEKNATIYLDTDSEPFRLLEGAK